MSEALEFACEKLCPVCGKKFPVLRPHMWAYKERKPNSSNYRFFCSWKCLRANEKKGEKNKVGAKRILTDAQENTAVAMAIKGEDPRPYLEECGCKNGQIAWSGIRAKLKENDPELYGKLPEKISGKKSGPKKPEAPKATPVEVHIPAPKVTAPLVYDGMRVNAVTGEFGTYYYDENGRDGPYLDYSNKAGDELSMPVAQWRMFLNELRRAAQILGVNI